MKLGVEVKIGAISALFVALIATGAALTSATIQRSRGDSRVINLAGRQRMLVQQMAKDAFAVLRGEPAIASLQAGVAQFDQTLTALLKGDPRQGLEAQEDPHIRLRLEHVLKRWQHFRPHAEGLALQGAAWGKALRALLDRKPELLAQLEATAERFRGSRLDGSPRQVQLAGTLARDSQTFTLQVLSPDGRDQDPAGTLALFERTLLALTGGDPDRGVKASRDPAVRGELQALRELWEPLRPQLGILIELGAPLRAHLRQLLASHDNLLEGVADAVSLLEGAAAARMDQLQDYETALICLALALGVGSSFLSRLLIVKPVARSAQLLAAASSQILTASKELEDVAQTQWEAIEDINHNVQSLSESATHISASAEGVRQNAERSRQTTDLTARRTEELSGRTTRVAELLESIRHIAERSDLLALNASLEGSRAGEAGRGFALVAKEIRRLAEAVSGSVVDVKKLVADIREAGSATVVATEEARKLAQSTAEASVEISMVTERQRNATLQLADSMQNISGVLSRSTISTRQTRAAAQDLQRQAERLSRVVARGHLAKDR
jgi:methyl-accepting chemotaxis protein